MGTLRDDVKHSIKMVFKNSGFNIVAVTALALALGRILPSFPW